MFQGCQTQIDKKNARILRERRSINAEAMRAICKKNAIGRKVHRTPTDVRIL